MKRASTGTRHPADPKLVEVAFTFHIPIAGGRDWNQVVVHAGLLRGRLDLSFSISGPAESRETLPASMVDGIRKGLEYAARNVQERDLTEIDPEPDEC